MAGMRTQFARRVRNNQGALAQDIKQLSAADTQPNGEHDDDNEQVQQQHGRNQHAFLR